jgi:hypothetical protein
MLKSKIAGLTAATALVAALAASPTAHAQMMAPMQAPTHYDLYSDMPKADPGDDPANWSARQNVVDSQRYEQLLHTNPAFLRARIQKECGSINEPGLYEQCVATFR